MIVLMPSPKPSSGNKPADRRTSLRSETTHRAVVRIDPGRDGPACTGQCQDVSAGGSGLVVERARGSGETFLVQPFLNAGKAGAASLLYRCVRCQPRGDQFLIGGTLMS